MLPPRRRAVGVDKYALKKGQALDLSFADIDTRPKVGGEGWGGVGEYQSLETEGDYCPD